MEKADTQEPAADSRSSSLNTDDLQSNDALEEYVEYIVEPTDGGWGWVIVCASLFVNFVIDGFMCSFGKLMTSISEGIDTPPGEVSTIAAVQLGENHFIFSSICYCDQKYLSSYSHVFRCWSCCQCISQQLRFSCDWYYWFNIVYTR